MPGTPAWPRSCAICGPATCIRRCISGCSSFGASLSGRLVGCPAAFGAVRGRRTCRARLACGAGGNTGRSRDAARVGHLWLCLHRHRRPRLRNGAISERLWRGLPLLRGGKIPAELRSGRRHRLWRSRFCQLSRHLHRLCRVVLAYPGATALAFFASRRRSLLPFLLADAWFFVAQRASRTGQFTAFSWRHALPLLAKDTGATLFGGCRFMRGRSLFRSPSGCSFSPSFAASPSSAPGGRLLRYLRWPPPRRRRDCLLWASCSTTRRLKSATWRSRRHFLLCSPPPRYRARCSSCCSPCRLARLSASPSPPLPCRAKAPPPAPPSRWPRRTHWCWCLLGMTAWASPARSSPQRRTISTFY